MALTVKVAGWLVFDRRVVDGDQCAITTYGRTRAECHALRQWSEHEGDDVTGAMKAWVAVVRR